MTKERLSEMLEFLLLSVISITLTKTQQIDSQRFCERYVECAAVATLKERLCLGNSRLRPHWLPDSRDPNDCHEKLRNDYIILERMEEQLDQELLTCLLQNSAPGFPDSSCNLDAYRSASIFAFGRSIIRTPVNCFSGVTKRIERECGRVKNCCPGVASCSSISTTSSLAVSLNDMKAKMRQRAADCQKGVPISKSPFPQCTTSPIEAGSTQPNPVMPPTVSANNGTNSYNTGEGQASVAEGAGDGRYDAMNEQYVPSGGVQEHQVPKQSGDSYV